MFFALFLLARSDFLTNQGLKVDITSDYCKSPLLEQIYLFSLDFSTVSAKKFLVSALKDTSKLEDLDYLMNIAKNVLDKTTFQLLSANLKLKSLVPKIEFAKSIKDYNKSKIFRTDLVVGKPTMKDLILVDLHKKEDSDKVLDIIEHDKDAIIRLSIEDGSCEKQKLNGYGIKMIPQKFIGLNDEAQTLETKIPTDETTVNVEGPTVADFKLETNELHTRFFQYIADHKDKDMLRLLRDVSNNWPLFMQDVFGNRATSETEKFFEELRGYVSEWEETSSINGRMTYSSIDVFSILDMIEHEKRFLDTLKSEFNITGKDADRISFEKIQPINYIFDYRHKNIDFLNDIEKDKEFDKLSSNFEDLYKDSVIPLVRKNLVDVVSYVDPSTISGYMKFKASIGMLNSGIPVRVGIEPHFNLNNKLSRKVAFAYHHIALKDPLAAVKFILRVANFAEINPATQAPKDLNELHFQKSYVSIAQDLLLVNWNDLHKLYSPDTPEYARLMETQNFYKEKGIKPGTVCINGRIEQAQDTPHAYYHIAQEEFTKVKNIIKAMGYDTWPEEQPIQLYTNTEYVVSSLKLPTTKDDFIIGLGIYDQPVEKQIQYIHELNALNWDYSMANVSKNYFMLFSESKEDIKTFMNFTKDEHQLPTKFAVNPKNINIPGLDKFKEPFIVCGGRVFEDIKITQENLNAIEKWFTFTIYPHVSKVIDEENPHFESLAFYIETMICDWFSHDIVRGGVNNEAFNIENNLLYNSKNDCEIKWQIAINPFSPEFQEMIDTIKFIEENKAAAVQLIPNPRRDIKTFRNAFDTYYRAAMDNDSVYFTHTNESNSYFVSPNIPASWSIEDKSSNIDVNDVNFNKLEAGVYNASYHLSKLVARGSILKSISEPAQGVEIELGGKQTTTMRDNGYWQFPVNASFYTLHLVDGPSTRKFYPINKEIFVDSYALPQDPIQVKILPGKERESLKRERKNLHTKEIKQVNIFTIPSDQEEEKCAKEMILSVINSTKSPVKFWIYNEFITSAFKETIKELSEKLNFEVEFVDYNRPLWLRPQMSKERIVKAKKILYLDVLFPLDLERVIYIDPCQIVKGNVAELIHKDLGNAAYGLPTFCDHNPRNDTMNQRFWLQGYWNNYLKGEPYHSTDLFVVDLQSLRETGASDAIRYYYQRLSGTQGSLSILDQDLLNYIQQIVPIQTLDQEWYWSKDMCSEETKDAAKIINVRPSIIDESKQTENEEESNNQESEL